MFNENSVISRRFSLSGRCRAHLCFAVIGNGVRKRESAEFAAFVFNSVYAILPLGTFVAADLSFCAAISD
jgi:hypothetical protein